MGSKKKDNPGLGSRVGALEVNVSSMKTDISWIKKFIAPTFLISLLSLLLMLAKCGGVI